ncbi:hypothetical protein RKD55_000646 [Rossellomorea marisflavi]
MEGRSEMRTALGSEKAKGDNGVIKPSCSAKSMASFLSKGDVGRILQVAGELLYF